MANIIFTRIENSKDIDNEDIIDGQIVVCGDGKLFVDYDSKRVNAGGLNNQDVIDITGNIEELNTEDKTNLVNAINELNKTRDFITLGLSSTFLPTETKINTFPFNKIVNKNGDLLTNYNDGILIGKGVHNIHVKGSFYFYTGTVGRKNIYIYRTRGEATAFAMRKITTYAQYHMFDIDSIIPVQEGDVITLGAELTAGDNIHAEDYTTQLTARVVN